MLSIIWILRYAESKLTASSDPLTELLLTALFFGSGFVATNYSFQGGSASFVETVKVSFSIFQYTIIDAVFTNFYTNQILAHIHFAIMSMGRLLNQLLVP